MATPRPVDLESFEFTGFLSLDLQRYSDQAPALPAELADGRLVIESSCNREGQWTWSVSPIGRDFEPGEPLVQMAGGRDDEDPLLRLLAALGLPATSASS